MMPLQSEQVLKACHATADGDDGDVFLFDLSPQQLRFWLQDRKDPGNPAYNGAFRHELTGTLNAAALEQAFSDLIERHEILRASCREIDGAPRLVVAERLTFKLVQRDLTNLPEPTRAAQMEALCAADARFRFDLARGPLIRVGLIKLEPAKSVLTLTLHHLVCDGWSIGLIMDELGPLYQARALGQAPSLTPLAVQYGDYATWLQDHLKSADIARQTAYWKRQLANYRRLDLAPDVPQPDGTERSAGLDAKIAAHDLPSDLIAKLKDFSNAQGGTLFITALTACTAVLRAASARKDIAVGTPVAARGRPEVEKIVGPLLNYVVLRSKLGGDPTLRELEADVQTTVLDAFSNQDVPLEHVITALAENATPPLEPFYSVSFISQRAFAGGSTFTIDRAGLKLRTLPSLSQGALYDLFFFLIERENGWRLSLEYRTQLFTNARAHALLADMVAVLGRMCETPDARLSELNLASALTGSDLIDGTDEESGPFQLAASYAQERFHLLDRANPGSATFNVPVFQRLSGELDADLLERALQAMVARHESLRTTFREIDGTLYQIIHEHTPLVLAHAPLPPAGDTDQSLSAFMRTEASKPFDLEHGPLIRATLVTIGAANHLLALTLHHIICDGQSVGTLQKELWTTYAALKERRPAGLAPLTIQYGDVAVNQREWLESPDAAAERAFWHTKLTGPLPVLDFPLDRAPGKASTAAGGIAVRTLAPQTVAAIKQRAQAENATVFAITAAAFATLLARYSNAEDVLFGCPVANRSQETAGLIGPFAGPLAVRVDLKGDPSLRSVLHRTRDEVFDALSNTNYPFERLASEIDARSVQGRKPLFQFYFLYQSAFVTSQQTAGLTITPVSSQGVGTAYEIQLALIERSGRVTAQLEYNNSLFDAATVESILDDYVGIVARMLETPDALLSQIPAPKRHGNGLLTENRSASVQSYAPPTTDDERKLVEIWQRLLGRAAIGIHDDFFAIGGQSMLAARLMIEIARELGVRPDLSLLANNRTIEKLARHLNPSAPRRAATLVPLQPLGSARPLFCIHGGGGHVLHYSDLAKVTPPNQPVYGLSAPELRTGDDPSVEVLASLYVAEIRKVQPRGPYKICGYSFGGIVAFEMAAQLAGAGEQTDMLIILDTANRAYYRHMPLRDRIPYWTTFLTSRGKLYLDRLAGGRWHELFGSIKALAHKQSDRLTWSVAGVPKPDPALAEDPIYLNTIAFDAAADRYTPAAYEGRVLLVRSSARAAEYKHNPSLGWEKVARGGVDVVTVPGDHLSMVKSPNVETLVAHLVEYQQSACR